MKRIAFKSAVAAHLTCIAAVAWASESLQAAEQHVPTSRAVGTFTFRNPIEFSYPH